MICISESPFEEAVGWQSFASFGALNHANEPLIS